MSQGPQRERKLNVTKINHQNRKALHHTHTNREKGNNKGEPSPSLPLARESRPASFPPSDRLVRYSSVGT